MRSTIDSAGRVVIPKAIRERLGLLPGEVELTVDGAALRLEPPVGEGLERESGWLVIPSSGLLIRDEDVQCLRDADQR